MIGVVRSKAIDQFAGSMRGNAMLLQLGRESLHNLKNAAGLGVTFTKCFKVPAKQDAITVGASDPVGIPVGVERVARLGATREAQATSSLSSRWRASR